jgi:hypothetical protein
MAENDLPEIVYHYTDQNGLLGILRTKQLWCTHLAYMNDASEYDLRDALIRDMLERLEATTQEDRVKEYARTAKNQTDYFREAAAKQDVKMLTWGPWVASFSALSDELGQWRAYSKTGSRYRIGFRTGQLCKIRGVTVKKVDYSRDSALARLTDAFIAGVTRIDASLPQNWPVSRVHPPDYMQLLQRLAQDIGVYCKHEKFGSEVEWRLVATEGGKIDFRAGISFLIPYVSIDLKGLEYPIESIIVGPCAHPDLSVSSVLQALFATQWRDGDQRYVPWVRKSEVPYRDW